MSSIFWASFYSPVFLMGGGKDFKITFACSFKTTIKTHGQNQGGGWRLGREGGLSGVGWRDGEKMQTNVTE